jgi:RNA polymerase sigma-70 factor (ECF subfamily)
MAPMDGTTDVIALDEPPAEEAGDVTAFEAFFELERAKLYGALVLLTRDRHEAEELMQDAFLRLLERWDRVASMDDPSGYLYRTALNLFRSRRRRIAVALRRVAHSGHARDDLAAVEENDVAVRALAALTPRQRAAVVLVDVLGFTSEEAAGPLGVKASTVRVLLSRGRAALRKEWTDHE